MKLYFRNSKGRLRVIAEPTSEKECGAAIRQFLNEHNFTNHYMRTWRCCKTGRTVFDVGSYTEFFELDENN